MTAQLSREQLKTRIEKALKDFTEGRASMHVPPLDTDVDMVLSDCLDLLAGMDSEPVGEVVLGDYDDCGNYPDAKVVCIAAQGQADWNNFRNGTKLYAAPPAPVSVPDDAALRILFEKWFAADCAFDESPSATEEDNLAWKESYWRVWCACRAAMLKAGPVTGWIKCSERMPGTVGLYCCCVDEDKTSGKRNCVINCLWDGNGWDEPAVRALGGTVTHWMPLPAAPEQEV